MDEDRDADDRVGTFPLVGLRIAIAGDGEVVIGVTLDALRVILEAAERMAITPLPWAQDGDETCRG